MAFNPTGILSSVMSILGATSAFDVVRVVSNGGPVFETARIMRASINNDSSIFSHPLEDGNSISDFKVELPIQIQLAVILPAEDVENVYRNLRQAKEKGTEFIIQTRADSYEHMVIKSMPHEESPEIGDCLGLSINFQEVQWFKPSVESLPATEVAAKPESKTNGSAGTNPTSGTSTGVKSDADTIKTGQKRSTPATENTQSSVLKKMEGWF